MSGKAGMTSQHEQTVTLDASAGALAGMQKIPAKYVQKQQNLGAGAGTRIVRSHTIQKETAGMSADYLPESNNVGVRFLSHS